MVRRLSERVWELEKRVVDALTDKEQVRLYREEESGEVGALLGIYIRIGGKKSSTLLPYKAIAERFITYRAYNYNVRSRGRY